MRDPYDVLGVAKNAASKDIKAAYRKLAKKHHPDQNPNDPKAKDRFADINRAYEVVGDEKNRGAFDRGEIDADGKPRFQGFSGAGGGGDPFAGFGQGRRGAAGSRFEFRKGFGEADAASDIFSQIFGEAARPRAAGGDRRRQDVHGADINVTLDIDIEDAVNAAKVTAALPDGRKIAVKLPAYVEDGQTIRLKGQGERPAFGDPGDALVVNPLRSNGRYRAEGRDLHSDLQLDLRDAVLGAKVAAETPTGKVAVSVPAWSSSDKVLRLKGRGLPRKDGGGGDLYVHVRLMLPRQADADLEALMKKIRV